MAKKHQRNISDKSAPLPQAGLITRNCIGLHSVKTDNFELEHVTFRIILQPGARNVYSKMFGCLRKRQRCTAKEVFKIEFSL